MEGQNKLYLPNSVAKNLPMMVKNELMKMSPNKQEEFLDEYMRKTKSVGLAYLFLLVVFSAHYGYLNKWGLQAVFWITGGGLLIWWIIDIFRLSGLVGEYNREVATNIMRDLKVMSM